MTDDEILAAKAIDQAMIDKIMANIALDTLAFPVKNAFRTSVLLDDGRYKTGLIGQDLDFTMTGLRLGAKTQVIFEFKPVEPTEEYVQMELDEKKVFDTFEGLEQMVVQALGYRPAPRVADGSYEEAYDFKGARERFRTTEKRRLRAEKAKAAAVAEKEREDNYADNPIFGSW